MVEDDSTLQFVTRMVMSSLGYKCEVVGSGEEAVERSASDIGLIFMDFGLPGIQGSEAAVLIRKKEVRERRKRVPIIALTAHVISSEKCLETQMDDYLQKPALIEDFKNMLNKWLPLASETTAS